MKILLAEDNADVRTVLALQLEARGHVVIQASDGWDACRKFTDDLQLVLTDFEMPRLDGVGLARIAAACSVPVVMMSGDPLKAGKALADAKIAATIPILWKPFDFEQLMKFTAGVGLNVSGRRGDERRGSH